MSDTWVVMASGPSMCKEDADYVRGKAKVIVVNTTFRLARWADVVYSNDHDWYEAHLNELRESTESTFWCGHPTWRHLFVRSLPFNKTAPGLVREGGIAWGMNSGGAALNLALYLGAKKIVMLGYDQGWDGDKPRWHGRHPGALQNQKPGFHRWAKWYEQAAQDFREVGVQVWNCSRQTTLKCFDRAELRDVL